MKQMYVKGRGQALLGAGVQCVELVFSIKNILLVGIKGLDGWCFFLGGEGGTAVFQVEV